MLAAEHIRRAVDNGYCLPDPFTAGRLGGPSSRFVAQSNQATYNQWVFQFRDELKARSDASEVCVCGACAAEIQRYARKNISDAPRQPALMPPPPTNVAPAGSSQSAVDPRWKAVLDRFGQYISISGSDSKIPADSKMYSRIRLHSFFRDYAHADEVLGRIPDEIMVLDPVEEGMSPLTGEVKYHVTHEGNLTGRQIKEYIEIVVEGGGGIWEALL